MKKDLIAVVGPRGYLDSPEELGLYEYDGSVDKAKPDLVVFPRTTEEVAEIVRITREKAPGAIVVVDGAQSAPHLPIDVAALGCDFFAISAHKMLGPTGVGALWGRRDLLEAMSPFLSGGSMVGHVTFESTTWAPIPQRFEAGTPPIIETVGLAAALDYLDALGRENIFRHDLDLATYAYQRLSELKGEGFNLGAKAGV